jgi:hypothetical protein
LISAAKDGRLLIFAIKDDRKKHRMEARVGIEPAYAALQAAA